MTSSGDFRTLDLPIVAGRNFTERDSGVGPLRLHRQRNVRPARAARADPIGMRIALQRTGQPQPIVKEIVGVARQTHGWTTDRDDFLQVYMPLTQYATGDVYMVARAERGRAEALTPLIRNGSASLACGSRSVRPAPTSCGWSSAAPAG